MQFPSGVEIFLGQALGTSAVLVVATDNPGYVSQGRGSVFLSMDRGQTYTELYVGGYAGTRLEHFVTVVVPNGDDVYIVHYSRVNNMVSFATIGNGQASCFLLKGGSRLPQSRYTVNELTDGHMAKVRKLESGG